MFVCKSSSPFTKTITFLKTQILNLRYIAIAWRFRDSVFDLPNVEMEVVTWQSYIIPKLFRATFLICSYNPDSFQFLFSGRFFVPVILLSLDETFNQEFLIADKTHF